MFRLALIFSEKAFDKDTPRSKLESFLEFVHEGDTAWAYRIDPLARSLDDVHRIVQGEQTVAYELNL